MSAHFQSPASLPARAALLLAFWLGLAASPLAASWRSVLYPETGYDPAAVNLVTGKVLQDFSYAGYLRGEAAIPDVASPIYDVTAYGANSTGTQDATAAIQSAIDAAGLAGGGVVFLPAGTYKLSVPDEEQQALLLNRPGVILRGAGRGQTFLLNETVQMRGKAVIRVQGPWSAGFWHAGALSTPLASDLLHSVREIPVESVAGFAVGDTVVIRNTITEAWITEEKETGWSGFAASLNGLAYRRTVLAVDATANVLTVDAPIRYALRLRDSARVVRLSAAPLVGVGLEDFSFGNKHYAGNEGDPLPSWLEADFENVGTPGHAVHNSYFIHLSRVRDAWVRRLESFLPDGNNSTAHVLSGGMAVVESTHVTIEDCSIQRPQYGGAGGNGYMFLFLHSGEVLVQRSTARFSRHGFSIAGTGSSGIVLHDCLDVDTGRATGSTGSYNTSGSGSDLHRHFSQAILFDRCTGENSWFEARYRPHGSDPKHNLTGVHSVFWNTQGLGSRGGAVVRSEQARHGYVIGTRGNRSGVARLRVAASRTDPIDHLEGQGHGGTLEPQSLFLDQRGRRLGPDFVLPAPPVLFHPADTVEITPAADGFTIAGEPAAGSDVAVEWTAPPGVVLTPLQNGAVRARVPGPGAWRLQAVLTAAGHSRVRSVTVVAAPSAPPASLVAPALADTFIEGDSQANTNNGTSTLVRIKRASTARTTRHGLLRFDLSGLAWGDGTLEAARLVLTKNSPATFAGWSIAVRAVEPSPAWTETGVTWNNAPAFGTTLATYEPSPGLVDSIDLTAPLLAAKAAGASTIDLALFVVSQPDVSILSYHSREQTQADLRPRLELDVLPSITRFENWIAQQPGVAVDQQDPLADPDGDGLPSLLEMALGRAPGSAEGMPPLAWVDGSLRFTIAELFPAANRLRLEQSTDLSTWQPVGLASEHIATDDDGLLHITRPVPLDGPRLFWRLRIEPE